MSARRYVGTVLLVGGCCVLVAGALALAFGGWMLAETRSAPEFTDSGEQSVSIPRGVFLHGSAPVYADVDVARLDIDAGCELTGQASGDSLRVDDLFFATGDEVTVDGHTWYPLVEVSLADDTPTLECPGLPDKSAIAVGKPQAFGSSVGFVAPAVLVAGPLFIILGMVGVLVGVLLRRGVPRTLGAGWQA